jgi:hypothetical protein
MKGYKLAIIFVAALFVGGVIGFFITGFATSGEIKRSFNFYYEPSSPAPIEELLLNADIGEVNIQYNKTNTPYYAKVEVNLLIAGLFMAGKTYSDFFESSTEWWNNASKPISFIMEVKPDVWFDPSHWFKSYNIDILVTLRTDIEYDITANLITGSLKMAVPENVVLNNTILKTTTGEILLNSSSNSNFQGKVEVQSTTGKASVISKSTNYSLGLTSGTVTGSLVLNFERCTMGHNLIGTTVTGSISYYTYNVTFIQDSIIQLQTTTGSVDAIINQFDDLGANVSGIIGVTTGSINIEFNNDKSSVGSKFTSTVTTGSVNYIYSASEYTRVGDVLTSGNYDAALYRYTLAMATVTGSINVNAESHH